MKMYHCISMIEREKEVKNEKIGLLLMLSRMLLLLEGVVNAVMRCYFGTNRTLFCLQPGV